MRNCKSENLRRNNSASAFDSARLLVNVLTDSWWIDNCLRNSSFCASNAAAVIPPSRDSAFSTFLDSDKELFPSAASPRASVTQPTKIIADRQLPIADLKNRKF